MSDIPYNVIVLQGHYDEVKEETLNAYDDLLSDCRTSSERIKLLKMFWEEALVAASNLVLEKQIQKNAQILKEINESFNYR